MGFFPTVKKAELLIDLNYGCLAYRNINVVYTFTN